MRKLIPGSLVLDADVEKERQKVKFKMRVENSGEHDYKLIVTTTLRDAEDKIVPIKTVKDDIDDNDSELSKLKNALGALLTCPRCLAEGLSWG